MNKTIVFSLIILFGNNYAQVIKSFRDSVRTVVQETYNSQYGGQNTVDQVFVIDSAKKDFDIDFKDPYNTLSGCILFNTYPGEILQDTAEAGYFIGVYKYNKIIWLSNPIMGNFNAGGHFDQTFDINNDGKVDLLHYWENSNERADYDYYYLNIISWNGNSGTFIN